MTARNERPRPSMPKENAGRSIFPTFAVNVPMPRGTAAPIPSAPLSTDALTDQEIEILACLGNGLPRRMIADRLNLAEQAIESSVRSILRKVERP